MGCGLGGSGRMAGDIFISYRRSDQAKAELLHRLLNARGVDSWYDTLLNVGDERDIDVCVAAREAS
ncbi:MAG: TIR domain-containing protein [Alphaproteobacteria bacterium]|nr:MAG: TIR domain-containing protein [Alphaproteobacteria bacterium]